MNLKIKILCLFIATFLARASIYAQCVPVNFDSLGLGLRYGTRSNDAGLKLIQAMHAHEQAFDRFWYHKSADHPSGGGLSVELAKRLGNVKIRFKGAFLDSSFSGDAYGFLGAKTPVLDAVRQLRVKESQNTGRFEVQMLGWELPKNLAFVPKIGLESETSVFRIEKTRNFEFLNSGGALTFPFHAEAYAGFAKPLVGFILLHKQKSQNSTSPSLAYFELTVSAYSGLFRADTTYLQFVPQPELKNIQFAAPGHVMNMQAEFGVEPFWGSDHESRLRYFADVDYSIYDYRKPEIISVMTPGYVGAHSIGEILPSYYFQSTHTVTVRVQIGVTLLVNGRVAGEK